MKKSFCILVLIAFLANTFGLLPLAQAQEFYLPATGVRVALSPEFNPPILKGIKVYPDNPFRFDFILDQGDAAKGEAANGDIKPRRGFVSPLQAQIAQKEEATKLIKYFLASLTIPEKDLWVNLSPYEKNRIIPQSFGLTEMGRDLLAEDYMLKQITASLIYPEGEIGKKFWKRIYEEAYKKFGTTNIPVNTFNKVWIVPEKAVVYENAKAATAYIVESKLKVMLEEDYLATEKNLGQPGDMALAVSPSRLPSDLGLNAKATQGDNFTQKVLRQIVIPELTKEVNEDKNFAQLRQVYNSLILATWYKKKIKDSILEQVYADKNKIKGVEYNQSLFNGGQPGDMALAVSPSTLPSELRLRGKAPQGNHPNDVEAIYQRYLQAFKKGVYNYIKEEPDPMTQEIVPRKYFSGGEDCTKLDMALTVTKNIDFVQTANETALVKVTASMGITNISSRQDFAMLKDLVKRQTDEKGRFIYESKRYYLGAGYKNKDIVLRPIDGDWSKGWRVYLNGKPIAVYTARKGFPLLEKDMLFERLEVAFRRKAHGEELLDIDEPLGAVGSALTRVIYSPLMDKPGHIVKDDITERLKPINDSIFGENGYQSILRAGDELAKSSIQRDENGDYALSLKDREAKRLEAIKDWNNALVGFEEQKIKIQELGESGIKIDGIDLLQRALDSLEKVIKSLRSGIAIAEDKKSNETTNFYDILKIIPEKRKTDLAIEGDSYLSSEIKGNPLSIASVIYNLIVNANKAAQETKREPKITLKLTKNGNELLVEFFDNGPGLPAKYLEVDPATGRQIVFNLNNTARKENGGTGLGTTEAYYVLQGRIKAENLPGGGAMFTMHFPITDAAMAESPGQWNWEYAENVPMGEITSDGTTVQNYYQNQKEVRKVFLALVKDMKDGDVNDLNTFSDRLRAIHKILITGKDGQSIYISPSFPDWEENKGYASDRMALEGFAQEIAGEFYEYDGYAKNMLSNLFENLKEFVDPKFNQMDLRNKVLHIGNFYVSFYVLGQRPVRNMFKSGNHSLVMNMVNAMLRLQGLNGISPGDLYSTLDDKYFMMGKYFSADVFLKEVQEANPGVDLAMKVGESKDWGAVVNVVHQDSAQLTPDNLYKEIIKHPGVLIKRDNKQYNVTVYKSLGVVVKVPKHESPELNKSVALVKANLNGIALDFIVAEVNGKHIIIQKMADRFLSDELENYTSDKRELLKQYFQLQDNMIQRGVFDADPYPRNYGVFNGKLYLTDIGDIVELKDMEDLMIHGFIYYMELAKFRFKGIGKDFNELAKRAGFGYFESIKEKVSHVHAVTPEPMNDNSFMEWLRGRLLNRDYRIMVIEHAPAVADIYKGTLSKLGYKVEAYNNWKDALAQFKATPMAYSFVLSDFNPGESENMTGVKLAQEFNQIRPDISIVINTLTVEEARMEKEREEKLGKFADIKEIIPKLIEREGRHDLENLMQIWKEKDYFHKAADSSMNVKDVGGIDLTPANMDLEIKKEIASSGIKFHLDPAMLEQLRSAPGFVPVIINIQPLNDLKSFLGIVNQTE